MGHALALLLAAFAAAAEPDWAPRARSEMVSYIRSYPAPRPVSDPRVLAAMLKVPRHEFVPQEVKGRAYGDSPLPIGEGQTISQPFIVAYMTQALELAPSDRVLEVGTGSGYHAAVLAELVREVYTIEIVPTLARRARAALERLGYRNVFTREGDGYRGWPEKAPFDAIIVTCAPDDIPKPLIDQLRVGGRMVIPVGERGQKLVLARKTEKGMVRQPILDVVFVPMTGESQRRRR